MITKTGPKARPWKVDLRDPSGRRLRPTFATKREAEDFEDEVKRKKRSYSPLAVVDSRLADRITVEDVWPKYIQRVTEIGTDGRGPASPQTIAHYCHSWDAYVEPRWGKTRLGSINFYEVEHWLGTMPAASDPSKLAGNRPRAEAVKCLRRILDQAIRLRYIDRNPCLDELGKLPRLPTSRRQGEHHPLTMSQLIQLSEHCGKLREDFKGFILLAGTSAPRWGEISASQGGDLLDSGSKLRIERAWSDVGGKLHLVPPKGKRSRVAPILPSVSKHLPTPKRPSDWLWRSPRGYAMRGNWFRKNILYPAVGKAQKKDSSFPGIVFHDLRHTAISLAISTGANVKVVQAMAGHTKATLTLDTYAGMYDQDLVEMADAVEILYKEDPLAT